MVETEPPLSVIFSRSVASIQSRRWSLTGGLGGHVSCPARVLASKEWRDGRGSWAVC